MSETPDTEPCYRCEVNGPPRRGVCPDCGGAGVVYVDPADRRRREALAALRGPGADRDADVRMEGE